MRRRLSESEGVKRAFRSVYFARERAETGNLRPVEIMSRIRQLGPLSAGIGFWHSFEHVVWRLAPVNGFLALAAALLLLNMDPDLGQDFLGAWTAGPEEMTLAEYFGWGG